MERPSKRSKKKDKEKKVVEQAPVVAEEEEASSCESIIVVNAPEDPEAALQSGKWKRKRLVCISDTHNLHTEIVVPHGDILIHAGDFVTKEKKRERYDEFNAWLGSLPHKHKVVICGNHEYFCKDKTAEEIQTLLSNCIYLQDSSVEIDGLGLYGAPWNGSTGMSFGYPKPKLQEKWDLIPKRIDVLITHMPPRRILDLPVSGRHWGCKKLRKHVRRVVKPKLHIFGHVHEGYGVHHDKRTVFINAATMPWPPLEDKSPVRDPIVVDIYYKASREKIKAE